MLYSHNSRLKRRRETTPPPRIATSSRWTRLAPRKPRNRLFTHPRSPLPRPFAPTRLASPSRRHRTKKTTPQYHVARGSTTNPPFGHLHPRDAPPSPPASLLAPPLDQPHAPLSRNPVQPCQAEVAASPLRMFISLAPTCGTPRPLLQLPRSLDLPSRGTWHVTRAKDPHSWTWNPLRGNPFTPENPQSSTTPQPTTHPHTRSDPANRKATRITTCESEKRRYK